MDNIKIYTVLSNIPLDIEGSNLEKTGWMPSEDDKKYMDDLNYQMAITEAESRNAKVMFDNIGLSWDSCDCGDGYGCSHGSYVYELHITNVEKIHCIEYTDGDCLEFYNDGKHCKMPTEGATIYDFFRACELCEIKLEFSEYAKSLFS